MKLSDNDIEDLLRRAPRPQPPASLKEKLHADLDLFPSGTRPSAGAGLLHTGWMRWWPSLAAGGLTAICLVVLGVQQTQINELRRSIEQLQHQTDPTPANSEQLEILKRSGMSRLPNLNSRAEIDRLRQEAQTLAKEANELPVIQAENAQLHTNPALQPAVDAQEFEGLKQARAKAQNIVCINHMKQLGLAVRVWANDHDDTFPPDVPSMANEISSTRILVCPDDPDRKPAANWQEWSPANLSYIYLGGSETEPSRVMFRCPVHGNVTLGDGSVQSSNEQGPPPLMQKDGKLYLAPAKLEAKDGN